MDESPGSNRKKRGGRQLKLKKNLELENVVVRETFPFEQPEAGVRVGEGGYITAEVNAKRYYGVLIDQESLRAASLLHIQDEASGLDLNKRMEALNAKRRAGKGPPGERDSKRQKIDVHKDTMDASADAREVEKFRFVPGSSSTDPGYRILLATYRGIDAASEGNKRHVDLIKSACDSGGDFVGDYYYQYQLPNTTLKASQDTSANVDGLRLSLPLNRFLNLTDLPDWYPISNNSGMMKHQSKALELLQLKQRKGHLHAIAVANSKPGGVTLQSKVSKPMESRSAFRVCVVGGGIAGLSSCVEIFRLCDRAKIEVEIILLEGRERLGGRIHTSTLSTPDKVDATIELGASWIHGTENNPIMSLACDAGASFVNVNEDVKMLHSNQFPVDPVVDERAGELFDQLLESAATSAWECTGTTSKPSTGNAVRWHAENLCSSKKELPQASPAPDHRQSDDTSLDEAVGASILREGFSCFPSLSAEHKYMLQWYTKNVEYALGANIADMSTKYWDFDDRHSFEGNDVLLKEGYSKIIDHLSGVLASRGGKFRCMTNCPASRIEYNSSSAKTKHQEHNKRGERMLALSDSCCVFNRNEDMQIKCDFVVCAVPLGVLKASISDQDDIKPSIKFSPELPPIKKDAISSLGFGLLNKVFLRFETAFWRPMILNQKGPTQFGNATSTFPYHYMFVDVGASWAHGPDFPPILMSLVSGREAAACELLSDDEIVEQVVETLKELCGKSKVPDPISFAITRWGSDEFSRGCYTFLPPGATEQDLETLQTPINGNGDSMLLEESEIMRLFFAGEHTTALHPSVTHGALLSGSRVASEVVNTMLLRTNEHSDYDRVVPIAHYRKLNPSSALCCAFCGDEGSTRRQGRLISLKRGSSCHNNCAEFSPEVEIYDGKWKNVLSAVSRSKTLQCHICAGPGASIGCSQSDCNLSVHFKCGEDTGWRFTRDGKGFYCAKHRRGEFETSRRVSVSYFISQMDTDLRCVLCGQDEGTNPGSMRAYIVPGSVAGSCGSSLVALHSFCAQFSNVAVLEENPSSTQDWDYANVGAVMEAIKVCCICGFGGATICCSCEQCSKCYHFMCAKTHGCNLREGGESFFCRDHDVAPESSIIRNSMESAKLQSAGFYATNGDVFAQIDGFKMERSLPLGVASELPLVNVFDVPLRRVSFADAWPLQLHAIKNDDSPSRYLSVVWKGDKVKPELKSGDFVISVNSRRLGVDNLQTLDSLVSFLNAHTQIKVTFGRRKE